MKLQGKKIEGMNIATIVLPRENGTSIILKAQAVVDYDDFDKLCPTPKPPVRVMKGTTEEIPVLNDPKYLKELDDWAEKKSVWTTLKSLEATDGLEWETIDMDDHTTWLNFFKEIADSGITPAEYSYIQQKVMDVCGMNTKYLEEATESFLAELATL